MNLVRAIVAQGLFYGGDTMLAHVNGEAIDPSIARKAMDTRLSEPVNAELYRKRQHSIEPVFGNIKANLGYRRFTRRSLPAAVSGAGRAPYSVHEPRLPPAARNDGAGTILRVADDRDGARPDASQ